MNNCTFSTVKKARALWQLMRLEHGLMLIIAILIGAMIAGKGIPSPEKLLFALLAALFLEAATFALNDYFDLEVDKKNRRMDRPLVRGDLQPATAVLIYFVLLPAGIAASLMVNMTCFAIAVVNAVVATLYDVKFKEIKVISNFYIAFAMAIPFVFGATAVSTAIPSIIYFIAFIAFLSGVAREIMKDVQDMEGDVARKTRSFPMYLGRRGANTVAAIFYIVAVTLSFVPFAISIDAAYHFDPVYLAIVLVTDAMLAYVAARLLITTDTRHLDRLRRLSLLAIFIGLMAFLAGAFV